MGKKSSKERGIAWSKARIQRRRFPVHRADRHADMEPDLGHEPVGAKTTPRFTAQVDIFIDHYRTRFADPDGLSAKAVIDAIVRAGVLGDDSAKEVREVRHRQFKVQSTSEERTEITIQEINLNQHHDHGREHADGRSDEGTSQAGDGESDHCFGL
jgi:hypothetical protein